MNSKLHILVLAVAGAWMSATAQDAAIAVTKNGGELKVSDARMSRMDERMNVEMNIAYDALRVKQSGAVVVTPMIINGEDTLRLESMGLYGRTAWYASRRNDRMPLGGKEQRSFRFEKNLPPVAYSQKVPFENWMNGADLRVEVADYGCAGCNMGRALSDPLARYEKIEYKPLFLYQTAVAEEVKSRELAGRAYIDFPVNRTEINPTYRNNPAELRKIIATIDSVKNDRDITVTAISIKGFASPEGSYANNTRLAQGRTEALKNYVQSLYHFPAGFIRASFDPEDWQGLREYVEGSSMPERSGILAVIDDPYMDPDTKDATIKKRYPAAYSFLLQNVYPGLRHSDYRIEYNVRSFVDPVEIRRLLVKEPGKLSLNEIYIAVQGLEPGSAEYNEIFETAARLFPDEPVANLNAANSLMSRGDLQGAERYLAKAGDSPEAIYARGVLAALNGDYDRAITLVGQAKARGLKGAEGVVEQLEKINN